MSHPHIKTYLELKPQGTCYRLRREAQPTGQLVFRLPEAEVSTQTAIMRNVGPGTESAQAKSVRRHTHKKCIDPK